MKGAIRGGNLAEVFRELVIARKSGLLFLRDGDRQKAIYLSRGRIVNAESNLPEESLGYRLLDEGLLTPQALETALRRVEPGTSLGDVLAAGGMFAATDLEAIQRSLAQQTVVSSFDWTGGSYEFQEGDFSFRGELDLDTTSLLLDGVRRMFDFEAAREKLLQDPRPFAPLQAPGGPLKLEPTEGFIFSRIDGTLAASDICALSVISEEMTCRVLWGLLAAGVIAYSEASTTAPGASAAAAAKPAPERPLRRETRDSFEPATPRRPSSLSDDATPTAMKHTSPVSAATAGAGKGSPSDSGFTPRGVPRVESYQPAGTTAPGPGRGTTGSFERAAGSGQSASGSFQRRPGAPATPASSGRTTGEFDKPGRGRTVADGDTPAWQLERIAEIDGLFESLDRLNAYAMLGLPRDAPGSVVEGAFRRLAEKFHPNKNPWATDDAIRSKLVFIYAKVKSAYDTLRDDRKRIEHDEQIRRHEKESTADVHVRMEFAKTDRQRAVEERVRESEGLYREAKKLMEAKSYHAAHERVLRAIEIYPEEARFFALAGRIESLNPNIRWQKDAEAHLRKATELDPWNADYPVALGQLYKSAGMKQKAKRAFIRALELDPANEVGLEEVPAAERPTKKLVPTDAAPVEETEDVDWS